MYICMYLDYRRSYVGTRACVPTWVEILFFSVDVPPTRGSDFWGPRESIYQILDMRKVTFMVDVRFELTTSSSSPADDALG